MKYIDRAIEKKIKDLSKEYACILLTGPRQVGKTTLFEHIDTNKNRAKSRGYIYSLQQLDLG